MVGTILTIGIITLNGEVLYNVIKIEVVRLDLKNDQPICCVRRHTLDSMIHMGESKRMKTCIRQTSPIRKL